MAKQISIDKLDKLIQKAQQLVLENNELKLNINDLKSQVSQLTEENKNQKNQLEDFNQQNKMVNIARVVSNLNEDQKKSIKQEISRQIKEIEQCIKLLKH